MWGSPNSVTMVAISAQTDADEELANFLTRKYFENTSATIRKSILFQLKISVAKVCHGNGGSSRVVPMMDCDFPCSWQMMHLSINS